MDGQINYATSYRPLNLLTNCLKVKCLMELHQNIQMQQRPPKRPLKLHITGVNYAYSTTVGKNEISR